MCVLQGMTHGRLRARVHSFECVYVIHHLLSSTPFTGKETQIKRYVQSQKISSAFVLELLYDGGLYRVYVQVFPDKARRREVGLIQVHCDDVRCSWTGNASKLEVPIFFQATPCNQFCVLYM